MVKDMAGTEADLYLQSLAHARPERKSGHAGEPAVVRQEPSLGNERKRVLLAEPVELLDADARLLERGNEQFRAGKYAAASASYRAAMLAEPRLDASALTDIRARANCAQCELKLGRPAHAERQASVAFSRIECILNARGPVCQNQDVHAALQMLARKCAYRRAQAWHALGQVDLATKDVEYLLAQEPCDQAARALQKKLSKGSSSATGSPDNHLNEAEALSVPCAKVVAADTLPTCARAPPSGPLQFEKVWRSLSREQRAAYVRDVFCVGGRRLKSVLTEAVASAELIGELIDTLHTLVPSPDSRTTPNVLFVNGLARALVDCSCSPRFSLHWIFLDDAQRAMFTESIARTSTVLGGSAIGSELCALENSLK
ncbi:hypothetical protein FVE85_1264 [Porphyridium purpureum]|uniref:Uncharacterized protein n=1 Tax=Porphyridium purpureum TaxID=35688 RepID=A0A5J4YJZ7_PORPP|nr:hypothetical protein FVE85_1264 [Porphyridium purpureum]|eukprot:POR4983..scf251_18